MNIPEFIQTQILLPRLQQTGVLVVYDPDRRYHDLCLELASDNRLVVDASESSIESREAALAALQELGRPNTQLEGLLIYAPAPAPQDDAARQRDPFSIYAVCGRLFPEGDGDEYQSLCLKAKPDHATEIRRLFADNPNPDFAVIDQVGGGVSWPQLQALLRVESAREILCALLAPSPSQFEALKGHDTWAGEARALFERTLGLKLITRAKTWDPIAHELWRYLLFSEFVFDLPVALPDSLTTIPRAPSAAKTLVEDLCTLLRRDPLTRSLYIVRAEAIEQELGLPAACQGISDLGALDTFPFEERTFFAQAVDALRRDNLDRLRALLDRHQDSPWTGKGENQTQWQLLETAASLIQACTAAEEQLPDHTRTQGTLIDFYLATLRNGDRLQREFEQAAADYIDHSGQMAEVLRQARTTYRRLAEKVQVAFVRHLEQSGWPPSGRLANADLFDRLVVPKLQESGHRVALLLIDALRYELGVELHKQLTDEGQIEIQAAFAQLPTITPVGMASLLPGASNVLRLQRREDRIVPLINDQSLTNVTQRMDLLRRRYGERFAEMPLREFIRSKSAPPPTVELFVIRSNEMDENFENNLETALSDISRTFQQLIGAIRKLRQLGFHEALIVTDHGFYLNPVAEAGAVCAKPPGAWLTVHDRFLLGDGAADAANFALPTATLGIRGEFNQAGGPRALVAYRAGVAYFHGGASLQETVVPVLSVRLAPTADSFSRQPKVALTYKRGAKRITTKLPVVEVTVVTGDLFSQEPIDLLIEAQDKRGQVVGEAKPGGPVNPATHTLSLNPGETVQVTIRMDESFEGKFSIKALDPATLTTFARLDLETDYIV